MEDGQKFKKIDMQRPPAETWDSPVLWEAPQPS